MSVYSYQLLITIVLIFIIMTLLQLWFQRRYSYWHRRKIPYLEPTPFVGNLKSLLMLRTSFGEYFRALYAEPTFQTAPFFGFFILQTPALLIRKPELIEQLLTKQFNSFPNRYEAADLHSDPMGALTLPLAKYAIWRKSRREISKLFTSGHIKKVMYPKLIMYAEQLEGYIARKTKQDAIGVAAVIEVKEMCALYTTDVTAALLYSIDTAGLRNDGCEMRAQCVELFEPSLRKVIDFFAIFFLPKSVRLLKSKLFTLKYASYLRRLVQERLDIGKRAHDSGDLIDFLLKMQHNLKYTEPHSGWLRHPDFIAAQVGIFLLAGFETSSSLIAFILYELAKQPAIQRTLKAEIATHLRAPQVVSYKQLLHMPYLSMVVAEGLRLYPTAPFINRECLPFGEHQTLWYEKGKKYLNIPREVPAYVSILGLHSDPKYWPNPQHYDPQRFSPERLHTIKPMTYIPFGAGPHGCIGSRLGILQVKLGLLYILKRHRVELCEKTLKEIRFDPKRFMLEAKGGLYLKFVQEE
ncbi:probable cytochrome P450 6t3 [Zeugodacus cucurbitae]|nr:probable cytochrome P450 6t3 [Zeugodacus cucurbitae]